MALAVRHRATLSLLIAAALVAAVHGTSSPAQGSRIETYRCCCPGDCHCTGDCCNHGPQKTRPGQPPRLRDGAGPPVWRDADRCGSWLVTLQRAPGPATTLAVGVGRGPAVDPDHRWLRFPGSPVVRRLASCVAGSSPRAPPAM